MCVVVNTSCEERAASTVTLTFLISYKIQTARNYPEESTQLKLPFLDLFSCQRDRFDELERIYREAVVAYFRLLACIYFEELEKTAKNPESG